MTQRRVRFTRFHAPYHETEVAGFLPHRAAELVEIKKVAVYDDLAPVDFDAMDRDALVAYAREHLGLVEEPPPGVTDEEIRDALRDAAIETLMPPAPSLDQLDAMDRVHLEAFAAEKAGLATIDPAMTDDALRAAIRANIASAINAEGGEQQTGGAKKSRSR